KLFRPEDFAELTTPFAALFGGFANSYLMPQPPLLCEEGNTHLPHFSHSFTASLTRRDVLDSQENGPSIEHSPTAGLFLPPSTPHRETGRNLPSLHWRKLPYLGELTGT